MEQVKLISYEKLEDENRELKIILQKLTHEMGNALTLLGASIYYVEANIVKQNVKCDIKDLKNDYTYICNLFKELREYNLTDSLIKKEITIGEMVKEIKNSFSKMYISDNMQMFVNMEENQINKKLYADPVMLKQALINIFKNSIEAVEDNDEKKGRQIDVRILINKILEDEYDNIGIEGKNEVLHIEICDNGKGIPNEYIDNIFEPMFTYGKKDGTGLGLSIVKRIVEKHKGKIKAVSALGAGTAIHIYLPIFN